MDERDMSFPECYKHCAIVKHLGVSECENIRGCRWKFKEYREVFKSLQIDKLHEEMKVDE